jgi:PAS domain S-box-containing protein
LSHETPELEIYQRETHMRSEEVQRRGRHVSRLVQEKASMAEIGAIIGSTLAIEDVYERFADEVRRIIPFDNIAINLIDHQNKTVSVPYVAGIDVPGRRPGDIFPLRDTIAEEAARTRKGFLVDAEDIEELARTHSGALPVRIAGLRSIMVLPLISRDVVIGTLVLMSVAAHRYQERDLSLAENVAAHISGAIANARLFDERRRAEQALRESEASLRSIFRAAPVGIGMVADRVLRQVNDCICEMTGFSRNELVGQSARILYPTREEYERVGREKYALIREQGTGSIETCWQRKDGKVIDVLMSSTPLDPVDWSIGVTFTALDITERKRAERERASLEEKLRISQKMEAIGTLAGGIAHDFNNILAAIIGYAELANIDTHRESPVASSLAQILKAAFRARDLVRQILMFSRQSEIQFGPLQLNLIIKETLKLLRASLPATIQVRQDLGDCGKILGDPTQVHQVVMNLCTNAYHAMSAEGGLLDISLSSVDIEAKLLLQGETLQSGRYLKLSVRDTGHGIDSEILHRIFEPYFTTREKGAGTGLGLAVVHGIVKNHRGVIQASSQVGVGSTFDVYLPMVEDQGVESEAEPEEPVRGGNECILFVDDEPALEELGGRLLSGLGYKVVTRSSSWEALQLFKAKTMAFDLVITDMTMPQLTGEKLGLEILRIRPEMPIILCTGFSEQISNERARSLGIRALVMKPFLKNEMARVIRRVLDVSKQAGDA